MTGSWRLWLGASVAMVAFASNSLLNRFALGSGAIDATGFSTVRIASGAAMLALLVAVRRRPRARRPLRTTGLSAVMLVVYAAAFSFAYLRIGAGTGALLLFGAVQTVMYGSAIARGERPGWRGWLALGLAATGVVALVAPGATPPDAVGAVLMLIAGVAWAVYTVRGRGSTDPLGDTADNFRRALPLVLGLLVVVLLTARDSLHADLAGIGLAVVSGALASALGYALWYAVLPRLTGIQAGIVQLAPAPLAIIGGLLLLDEHLTWRVVLASLLVLTGVGLGLVTAQRARRSAPSS